MSDHFTLAYHSFMEIMSGLNLGYAGLKRFRKIFTRDIMDMQGSYLDNPYSTISIICGSFNEETAKAADLNYKKLLVYLEDKNIHGELKKEIADELIKNSHHLEIERRHIVNKQKIFKAFADFHRPLFLLSFMFSFMFLLVAGICQCCEFKWMSIFLLTLSAMLVFVAVIIFILSYFKKIVTKKIKPAYTIISFIVFTVISVIVANLSSIVDSDILTTHIFGYEVHCTMQCCSMVASVFVAVMAYIVIFLRATHHVKGFKWDCRKFEKKMMNFLKEVDFVDVYNETSDYMKRDFFKTP